MGQGAGPELPPAAVEKRKSARVAHLFLFCPQRPLPHEYTRPSLERATEWFSPAATEAMRCFLRASMRRGVCTSLLEPCPSRESYGTAAGNLREGS